MPKYNPKQFADVKPWVITAVVEEDQRDTKSMWAGETSAMECQQSRLQRINFLRKQNSSPAVAVANRLESCKTTFRCLSGACPECGRLFQRWLVRKSKDVIANHVAMPGKALVSVTIAPTSNLVPPGQLQKFSISDLHRRFKWAMNKFNLGPAFGGVDFSFNEDRDRSFAPVWSVHAYIISATPAREQLQKSLRDWFKETNPIHRNVVRPVKVSRFTNDAYRRSYALKMHFERRISYREVKIQNGKKRICRNTSSDKLRAQERLELFLYLDHIGLAQRVILSGLRAFGDGNDGVKLRPWGKVHRING